MPTVDRFYEFEEFCLTLHRRSLTYREQSVPLAGRPFDLLALLLERAGEVVSKHEFKARVWPHALVVEDHTLSVTLAAVRKALRVSGGDKNFIAAVSGRGYQFQAPVTITEIDERPVDSPTRRGAFHDLPIPSDPLIGREREVAKLLTLLAEERLVTLMGAGGIGKTRLAIALAAEAEQFFPDGVWFVELAPLADPQLVAETIAGVFGLTVQADRPKLQGIITFLRQKRLLLVLDNCEQLIAECARVATALIGSCPQVKVLATSRERLAIGGERVYRVPPLATPENHLQLATSEALRFSAIRLFVDRATLALDEFSPTGAEMSAIAEICRRLDGLPLAIELAAAWVALLRPEEILARLDQRFRLLVVERRSSLPRHQTLKATIDWSYALLSDPERALLRRLAVFAGSFTTGSACAVFSGGNADEPDAIPLMLGLVDKSLIVPVVAEDGERRFRLLESTKLYGEEKLLPDERSQSLRNLALYLLRFYANGERTWPTTATDLWRSTFEPELDNLRAVLDWAFGPDGDARFGVELVAFAQHIWLELSFLTELRRWLALATANIDDATPGPTAARLLLAEARHPFKGDLQAAQRASDMFRQIGDTFHAADATAQAGRSLVRAGRFDDAELYLHDGIGRLREAGPTKLLTLALYSAVFLCWYRGDIESARRYIEEIELISAGIRDQGMLQTATLARVEIEFVSGRIDDAISRARAAQAAWRAPGQENALANISRNLAGYLLTSGDGVEARPAALVGLRLAYALGKSLSTTICLQHLAQTEIIAGEAGNAARFAGYCAACYESEGIRHEAVEQALWEDLQEQLQRKLPPSVLSTFWAEGAAWTEDEAVNAALSMDDGSPDDAVVPERAS